MNEQVTVRQFDDKERGSIMALAVFALVLLSAIGLSLLAMTQNEMRMSRSNQRDLQNFYRAEAGLEHGRAILLQQATSGASLGTLLTQAAGDDGRIDFDPDQIEGEQDDGESDYLTYGDDVPLQTPTDFAGGWYAVFLANDPLDGSEQTLDTNSRVVVTSIAGSSESSQEILEAIVVPDDAFPSVPPAAVMLLGPAPTFDPGTGGKSFVGDDCGVSGRHYAPTIGVVSDAAETAVETAMAGGNPMYASSYSGADAVANLTDATEPTVIGSGYGALPPAWTECASVRSVVEKLRRVSSPCPTPCSPFPVTGPGSRVFVDGDLNLGPTVSGNGLLVVTGALTVDAAASWDGVIVVAGEGSFQRTGSLGIGVLKGSTIVANIAGPDNVYGTGDDCTGGDAGFASAEYLESAGSKGDTFFCSTSIDTASPLARFEIVGFRQH